MFIGLEEVSIQCPYCGETIPLLIDASYGTNDYYEDCSVCCRPIHVYAYFDEDERLFIDPKRDDD